MAKGQKQKKRAVPSHLAPAKKMKKFQKKKAKDAAVRTPYASDANEVGDAAAGRKENGATGRQAGFIFWCSTSMKPQCFQYRVFGLPRKGLELMEKIRKGTKLFLLDLDLMLLYGGYKAISNCGLNLEPAAFNGTRPAQVKFKIVKYCIPLPVGSFEYVIRENYVTGKCYPELNSKQVKELMSLFLPISAAQCPPSPHMFGERHRLAPYDWYRSGLYGSVIPPPQDAYGQPVAGTGLPPPREVYYQHPSAAGLPPPQDEYGQPVAGAALRPPRDAYYQHASAVGLPLEQDGYGQPVAGTGLLPPRDAYYQHPASAGLPPSQGRYGQPVAATGLAPPK